MRHNVAIPQSTLLALGLRDNLAALITELKAGMAALQEDSTKVQARNQDFHKGGADEI